MKNIFIKRIMYVMASSLMMLSCADDYKLDMGGGASGELTAMENKVVLSLDNSAMPVLSLVWQNDTPNILSYFIQVSDKEDFSTVAAETAVTTQSKSYTGTELNGLVKGIGILPDVESPVYFRLRSTKQNRAWLYSNVVKVNVTAFEVDMSYGTLLEKSDYLPTLYTLASPAKDGVYKGFVYTPKTWYNFWFKENDGKIWGQQAVDKTEYIMVDNNDKQWACWYPGVTGCFFTEIDTKKKLWSSLYLPLFTVTGGIQADMTFMGADLTWETSFSAASATTLKIKIQGTGKLYDYTTKTDNAKAKDTLFAFAQSGENLVQGAQAGDISVTVPSAGDYRLILNLSNPKAWKCYAVSK